MYRGLRGAGATPLLWFTQWPLQTSGAVVELVDFDSGSDAALCAVWFLVGVTHGRGVTDVEVQEVQDFMTALPTCR